MSWSKFHFNCRFLNQKLSEEVPIEKAQELLSNNYSKHQIGGVLKESSIKSHLFEKMIAESDPKRLKRLFSIYGSMNLSWDLSALSRLRNIRNYLFVLLTVFIFISSVYKFFVLPAFINVFEEMDLNISSGLERFDFVWGMTITLMLLISFILLRFNSFVNKIDKIDKTDNNFNSTFFYKLLISKKIIKMLKQIDALLYAPIEIERNEYSAEQITIYKSFESDNLNTSTEVQNLIGCYRVTLIKLINARITKLLALFSIVIIAAIGYLVFSAYQPIFSLGMII